LPDFVIGRHDKELPPGDVLRRRVDRPRDLLGNFALMSEKECVWQSTCFPLARVADNGKISLTDE
jgi:hypothetical protein